MIVILVLISLLGVVTAVALPGWSDLLLLSGPCLLASLWLWWRGWTQRADGAVRDAKAEGPHVIIDGSNVMHWQDNKPALEPLMQVIARLDREGWTVGVIFDATVGYRIHDRYQDDADMARRLGLPVDRVLVVPKGVAADEYILKASRQLGAKVVTNDRYRDWQAAFPEVAAPGFLIRGGVKEGTVWLHGRDLAAAKSGASRP